MLGKSKKTASAKGTYAGPKGKCEGCVHCRFIQVNNDGSYGGGLCELGPKLRGVTTLPKEQTCDSWEPKL